MQLLRYRVLLSNANLDTGQLRSISHEIVEGVVEMTRGSNEARTPEPDPASWPAG